MPALIQLTLALLLLTALPAHAQQAASPDEGGRYFAKFGVGSFNINEDDDTDKSINFRAEVHASEMLWNIHPFAAIDVNTDAGIWGGAGVAADFYMTPDIVITPSVAPGFYAKGDSVDLGGALEFRTGLELAFNTGAESRLGIEFSHYSNAGIYDENPGTEAIMLNYHFPTGL